MSLHLPLKPGIRVGFTQFVIRIYIAEALRPFIFLIFDSKVHGRRQRTIIVPNAGDEYGAPTRKIDNADLSHTHSLAAPG